MSKWLRNFIVCILVLALPAQGFAAAGMLACSPGHAQLMVAPDFDAPVAETVETIRHDHSNHHHALQSAHIEHHPAPQAGSDGYAPQFVDVVSSNGGLDNPFSMKCSACATCCFGAALVPADVMPGTPDLALMPLLSLSLAPLSFLTDGPVRPPRAFLA